MLGRKTHALAFRSDSWIVKLQSVHALVQEAKPTDLGQMANLSIHLEQEVCLVEELTRVFC